MQKTLNWVDNLLNEFFRKKEEKIHLVFKAGPRIDTENEIIYLQNGKQEQDPEKPYSKVRWGNIVFYSDFKDGSGYPICLNKGFWTQVMIDCFTFETLVISGCDKFRGSNMPSAKHKPMFYRCAYFFTDNAHLSVKEEDVPKECEWLHEFMNWYEDTYGEQPKIYRGDWLMNEDYFKHNI